MEKKDIVELGKSNGVNFSVQAINICFRLKFDEKQVLSLIEFYKKGIQEVGGKVVIDFIVKGMGE